MKKILFVLLAAILLVSCTNKSRNVYYRVKDCVYGEIDVLSLDSGYRVNDTLILSGWAYNKVILERVK